MIKEMTKKLEEKDKVIAETKQQTLKQTICLNELKDTIKALNTKSLIG